MIPVLFCSRGLRPRPACQRPATTKNARDDNPVRSESLGEDASLFSTGLLHGLVERRPLVFEALLLDLPQLGIADSESLGHGLPRHRNGYITGILGVDQVEENVLSLLDGQSFARHINSLLRICSFLG